MVARKLKSNYKELNCQHLWFDINSELQERIEQEANNYLNNYNRAYLNLLAQEIIFPYLQEDFPDAKLIEDRQEFWKLGINGTVVLLGDKKLALIPSESYDIDELRVDREWVDIPEFAADYFLAVQVDTEENMMRIWGYTTHKELKEKGTETKRDRSYSLDRVDIKEEINAFWIISRHFPSELTRDEIRPISEELSEDNLVKLTNQLANSQIIFPRRIIDFEQWGKLISQKKRRVALIEHRYFDSTFRQISNKQFTAEELTKAIAKFDQIFNDFDELDQPYEGAEVLADLLEVNQSDVLARSRSNSEVEGLSLVYFARELFKQKKANRIDDSGSSDNKVPDKLFEQIEVNCINNSESFDNKVDIQKWSIIDHLKNITSQGIDRANTKIDELAEQVGWLWVDIQASEATRSTPKNLRQETPNKYKKKLLNIAGKQYELRIKPVDLDRNIWTFELRSADTAGMIPPGFKFRLLDEKGQEFANNERVAEEGQEALTFANFKYETGKGVIWEIEPTPDNYQREIICF